MYACAGAKQSRVSRRGFGNTVQVQQVAQEFIAATRGPLVGDRTQFQRNVGCVRAEGPGQHRGGFFDENGGVAEEGGQAAAPRGEVGQYGIMWIPAGVVVQVDDREQGNLRQVVQDFPRDPFRLPPYAVEVLLAGQGAHPAGRGLDIADENQQVAGRSGEVAQQPPYGVPAAGFVSVQQHACEQRPATGWRSVNACSQLLDACSQLLDACSQLLDAGAQVQQRRSSENPQQLLRPGVQQSGGDGFESVERRHSGQVCTGSPLSCMRA